MDRPSLPPSTAPVTAAGPPPRAAWDEHNQQDLRPYALTGGRTRPRHPMRLDTVLEATSAFTDALAPEAARAVALCRGEHRSVAEIAARLALPAPVTKVIISDLIDCGALARVVPRATTTDSDTAQVLEALLDGLHARLSDVA